jgi:sec-independent protein translocase protein TatA
MNAVFAMLNGWEIVVILAVVLVMFGAKRLPELARGLGEGVREFRKNATEPPEPAEQEKKLESDPKKTEFI